MHLYRRVEEEEEMRMEDTYIYPSAGWKNSLPLKKNQNDDDIHSPPTTELSVVTIKCSATTTREKWMLQFIRKRKFICLVVYMNLLNKTMLCLVCGLRSAKYRHSCILFVDIK